MATIKVRRGTSTQAAVNNPILEEGEPGYEVDTFVFKIGDGVTPWNELPAITGTGGGGSTTNTLIGVEHDGSSWPIRPPGGLAIRVHWIGGSPSSPPPEGISGHDLWSVPME